MIKPMRFVRKCFTHLYSDTDLQDAILSNKPLKKLKEELTDKPPKPPIVDRIDYSKTMDILRDKTNAQLWLSDQSYGLIDKQHLERFLRDNKVDLKEYLSVKHDCDDFSYELMGATSEWCSDLAFGIIFGDHHAFNVFIDQNREVWGVEPQTDNIKPLNEKIDKDDVWVIMM